MKIDQSRNQIIGAAFSNRASKGRRAMSGHSISVFVNLPVKDLKRSRAFFGKLGFSFNEQFSDDTAASMVISEHNYAMLLTHEKFAQFTPRKIADAHTTSEVLTALLLESREAVDAMMDAAIANGGKDFRETQDLGFMYGRAFTDPDGHIWEIFFMDMSQMPQGEGEAA
jgi:uncharacterized protein